MNAAPSSVTYFPSFTPLTFDSYALIRKYTKKFQPYSDFNFVSMYCWNIDDKTAISDLNGNLVIRMKDYHSNKKIYSFIGLNKIEHTMKQLFESVNPKISALTFVPKVNFQKAKALKNQYSITSDRNHFDYIYSTKEISLYEGSKYHNKRNLVKRFEETTISTFRELDLKNKETQKQILRLNTAWTRLKKDADSEEYADEMKAIKRFFHFADFNTVKGFGLFDQDRLISFMLFELLPKKYALMHFKKSNLHYLGVSEYALKKIGEYLFNQGYHYLNFEQDLGVIGLRKAKLSNRPVKFLKKYLVTKKN